MLDISTGLQACTRRNGYWLPSNKCPEKIGKTRKIRVKIHQMDMEFSLRCRLQLQKGDENNIKCFLSTTEKEVKQELTFPVNNKAKT